MPGHSRDPLDRASPESPVRGSSNAFAAQPAGLVAAENSRFVYAAVASLAKYNQVLLGIFSRQAAKGFVVDFKVRHRTLAAPAISVPYLLAQLPIISRSSRIGGCGFECLLDHQNRLLYSLKWAEFSRDAGRACCDEAGRTEATLRAARNFSGDAGQRNGE